MENQNEKSEKSENNDLKIHFGEKVTVCFACGQKVEENTKRCPYCKTLQINT